MHFRSICSNTILTSSLGELTPQVLCSKLFNTYTSGKWNCDLSLHVHLLSSDHTILLDNWPYCTALLERTVCLNPTFSRISCTVLICRRTVEKNAVHTFVSQYSHSNCEQCTQDVQESNGYPLCPVVFTFGTFIPLLDTCKWKKSRHLSFTMLENKTDENAHSTQSYDTAVETYIAFSFFFFFV